MSAIYWIGGIILTMGMLLAVMMVGWLLAVGYPSIDAAKIPARAAYGLIYLGSGVLFAGQAIPYIAATIESFRTFKP